MTKLNFFDVAYLTENARNDAEFGVCDPGNSKPAYTTTDAKQIQATILNPHCHTLQFVPIDHNLNILRSDGNFESTCDGMIYDGKTYLAFIELKDKKVGWANEAVEQLRTTIGIFEENHNAEEYKHRYAFAVNVQHPVFHHSFKEVMQQFKATTKFVLRYGTTIKINYH